VGWPYRLAWILALIAAAAWFYGVYRASGGVRGLLAVGVLSVVYNRAERLYERRVPPMILLFVGLALSCVYWVSTWGFFGMHQMGNLVGFWRQRGRIVFRPAHADDK
jgi:hypothetical protein